MVDSWLAGLIAVFALEMRRPMCSRFPAGRLPGQLLCCCCVNGGGGEWRRDRGQRMRGQGEWLANSRSGLARPGPIIHPRAVNPAFLS